jgi:PPP family 3-phenylpropionic acid transporter
MVESRSLIGPLPRFLALYAALFAGFGVASPFIPELLASKGLEPRGISVVLASGTAIRLIAGPSGGRFADRSGEPRLVLVALLIAASFIGLGYVPAITLSLLLLVSVLQASAIASVNPIADALALRAASVNGFEYGWVRGTGSAAFIIGTVLSGLAIGRYGPSVIIWFAAALLFVAALVALRLPSSAQLLPRHAAASGMLDLRRVPWFGRLMLVAALVEGSHALHDGFAVIRWHAAGIGPGIAGLLWSESVVAEIVVFAWLGPALLRRLGAGGASVLAAAAGVLRWGVMAQTALLPAMALIEPLHGLTFALLHLACMRLMGSFVPAQLAATAQAFYTTVAVGATTAVLTLASGSLYQAFGARSFWAMALLCALALPFAFSLRPADTAQS